MSIFNDYNIGAINIHFIRALLVTFGCFIIAVGFSVLAATNIGVAPNDIVPFIIQDKTKAQYRWIRIALDAGYLTVGFILRWKNWSWYCNINVSNRAIYTIFSSLW